MAQQQRAPGVCLVRVQAQNASLLITVIQTPDVSRRFAETTASFSDVDAALEAVKQFLVRFTVQPPAPHLPDGLDGRYGPASA